MQVNKEDKFKEFLKKIFQFNKDKIDLDFGVYRVFKRKQEEIQDFIDNELKNIIDNSIKKHLTEESKEKINEIRNIVFEHILSFFERFYEDGDFYPVPNFKQNRNQKGVYHLDYNGEEVLFYWITKNQHYIKSINYYNNYKFELDGREIVFQIDKNRVDEIKGNQKETRNIFLVKTPEELKESNQIIVKLAFRKNNNSQDDEVEFNVENLFELLKDKLSLPESIKEDLQFHIDKFKNLRNSDFFIHKNLKNFLTKELEYFLKNEVIKFDNPQTLKEAVLTKEIGIKIIEFLSKMEDLQLLLWEKKKFAYDVNYVITLDRLKNIEILKDIERFEGFERQKEEWKELGFINDSNISLYELFIKWNEIKNLEIKKEWLTDKQKETWESLFESDRETLENIFYKDYSFLNQILKRVATVLNSKQSDLFEKNDEKLKENIDELPKILENYKKYKTLPIDTKYFPHLKYRILEQFDNLEEELDGILIKSDNYQALNTILPKYKEKVQTIYIDPPFNTGKDFLYKDNYQDATWLTLMQDRLKIAKELLNTSGSLFLHLDENADHYGRFLLNEIFGEENYLNEIIWVYERWTTRTKKLQNMHDYIQWFAKNYSKLKFFEITEQLNEELLERKRKGWNTNTIKQGDKKLRQLLVYDWDLVNKAITEGKIDKSKYDKIIDATKQEKYANDVWSIQFINPMSKERTNFQTQKPEELLYRIINSTSDEKDYILDFFLGSGTTISVAHKLKRKWIGVELDDHFETIILLRMKKVLYGDNVGISKEVNWQGGGFFKYLYLEQYEDTLENVEFNNNPIKEKTEELKKLQELFPELAEQELLNLLSDVAINNSKSLLMTVEDELLTNPFEFKLNIDGEEKVIDLIETYNLIKPLNVRKIFEKEFENRKYVFVISDKEAVIWREIKELSKDINQLKENIQKEEKFIRDVLQNIDKFKNIYTNAINQYYPKNFLDGKAKELLTDLRTLLIKDFSGKNLSINN
ncbi:site-specific DNA-methyltransferase [Sulfurihydrogenibium subterraneum]|uniref:site-specific DNA-methyltransferase n=1 Tax=Sulfurihydrogenibium subterraneum TaxID=171121 RepID=UPI0006890391|nr:DNA methyltransferase [Sulfurihydrogenibium subterraneum]